MSRIISSNYIGILQILTKEELISFEKWLNSPWCNSNKNLAKLFLKLKQYHPDFAESKLSDEELFRRTFLDKKYSYHAMRNLLSQSCRQAEQFLIHRRLQQNEGFQKDFLAEEFRERQSGTPFFKITREAINQLEEKEVKDWEDHLDLLQWNRRAYNHPNPNPLVPSDQSILKMDENLELVYLLEKAAIINEKIFRTRLLKNENHDVTKDLEIWNAATADIQNTSIEFYKRRFAYSPENMLEEFKKLQNDFFERFEELNKKDQKTHLFSLRNDISFLRRKKLLTIKELLPLYKFGLKTKALLVNGNLTNVTYTTVVIYSNAVKDFDYTKSFIKDYTKYLIPSIAKDAENWANAHTAYRMGELSNCIEILRTSEFKMDYFIRITKVLNVQAYFDLFLQDVSYQSFLMSYCANFEKWLRREKKLSKYKKEAYLRLIQKCKELASIYSDIDFKEEKLSSFLYAEKNIEAISWLKSKRDEILKLKKSRS